LCVLVAVVHGLAWTVINPPMQGPDEFTHAQQVDALARTFGADDYRPADGPGEYDLFLHGIPFSAEHNPSWSPLQSRLVRREVGAARWRGPAPSYGIGNPPLYYLLDALPTRAVAGDGLLDRLWAMRLGNLFMFACTTALCFLFVRELFPRHPWAWAVGGLAVALQPVAGFIAGSVSVDNLLYVASAGLFYALARAFRRGLSARVGVAIGAAALLGSLTKGIMFGLLPGAAFGVLLLAIAAWRRGEPRRVLGLPATAAAFALPFAAWIRISQEVLARPSSTTTGGYSPPSDRLHYAEQIASYTWQVFLPRLPFMHDQYQDFFNTTPPFPAFPQYALWQTWLEGFVGRFGWHQFNFPSWVNVTGAVILVSLSVLAARAVWRATNHLRCRRGELATYALIAAGAFMLVTIAGYGWRASRGGLSFEQMRYLLPLLPLYAALVTAACVSLRRAWALGLAGLVVVLAAGHALGALLLTLGRYYS
jgi:4-amino-4-deoxy-L-arabinose transferase-like glycosyltransferase